MRYTIHHKTRFMYEHWVGSSHNLVRLSPRNTPLQKLLEFRLKIDPPKITLEEYKDFFGNTTYHMFVSEPHSILSVTAESVVELDNEALTQQEQRRRTVSTISYEESLARLHAVSWDNIQARQFLLESPLIATVSPEIQAYGAASIRHGRALHEGISELMNRIFADFTFENGFSEIATPVASVFKERKGVCQDFAHLMIAILRSLGICARYASGYIETLPPPGGEKLFGADASHAWVSVYFPGHGWFDFDPTNDMVPHERHILLGYGRDYSDIAPMQGVIISSGLSRMEVKVDVRRSL